MAHNNGVISRPVNVIDDVAYVLGENSGDVGTLCTSNIINKWSKNKPIRYYDYVNNVKTVHPGTLTDAQRKGTSDDQSAGIYYGLKLSGTQAGQDTSTWPNLHGSTFEYQKPRGASQKELYRILDFTGYCHSAVPNPYGSFGGTEESAVGYFNNANGITGITVQYSGTNSTGVDLSDILLGTSETRTTVLSQTYPCIIIGKGNTHYITALGFEGDPNHAPRPLYYNNAYVGGHWIADTSKLVYGNHGSTAPWTAAENELQATIVLLRSAKSSGIFLDAAGTQDLSQYWIDCSDAITTTYAPVPVPGAVNINLSLVAYTNGITVSATNVIYQNNKIRVPLAWTGTPVGSGAFTCTVNTTIGATSASPVTLSGNVETQFLLMAQYNISDFDIIPGIPTQYHAVVTVVTQDGSATNTSTQEFDITI